MLTADRFVRSGKVRDLYQVDDEASLAHVPGIIARLDRLDGRSTGRTMSEKAAADAG